MPESSQNSPLPERSEEAQPSSTRAAGVRGAERSPLLALSRPEQLATVAAIAAALFFLVRGVSARSTEVALVDHGVSTGAIVDGVRLTREGHDDVPLLHYAYRDQQGRSWSGDVGGRAIGPLAVGAQPGSTLPVVYLPESPEKHRLGRPSLERADAPLFSALILAAMSLGGVIAGIAFSRWRARDPRSSLPPR